MTRALTLLLLALPAFASAAALDELRGLGGESLAQAAPPTPPAPRAPRSTPVYYCAFGSDGVRQAGTIRSSALGGLFARLDGAGIPGAPLRISDDGVSRAAQIRARVLVLEMFAQSPASVMDGLNGKPAFLVVIPRDKKLTDIPAFARLRGVRLPDGRVWDDVRGVGFVSQGDGSAAIGVGEENLLEDAADGYPKGYLVAHEVSHAVNAFGLGDGEDELESRFQKRKRSGLPFSSRYASTNAYEYFAVAAAGFFQSTLRGSDPEQDFGWLRRNDAWMPGFLGSVYGAPRSLWPMPSSRSSAK